jgi:hypothetical protein
VGVRLGERVPAVLSASGVPVMLGTMLAFVLMAAAVAVWLELLVRSAGIQIAVMFLPLFLSGLVWPATARYARRLAEVLAALVLSKLVVTGILSLGVAAIGSGDLRGVLSGTAMFVLAAFAPWVVLALIPVAVDAGHLSSSRRNSLRVVGEGRAAVTGAALNGVRSRVLQSPAASARSPRAESVPLPIAGRGPGRSGR